LDVRVAIVQVLLEKGMRPTMARLTLARKIAAISLTIWKKGVSFPEILNRSFLRQFLAHFPVLLWIESIFNCACVTSGRFGKNVMKSRYSSSACLKAPSAYHASAMESFA
jgi:hypothetical protein